MDELDVSIPSSVKKLIDTCWHKDDKERPCFEIIKDELFVHVSKIQSELQHAYAILTDQEKMMDLSNGMETRTVRTEEHTPTSVLSKMILIDTSLRLIDLCT